MTLKFKIFLVLSLSLFLLSCSNKDVQFNVTSKEIYKEFQENEVAALAKYKGKKIRVTGILISFSNVLGTNYCYIGSTGDIFGEVACAMSDEFAKNAGQFKKGQEMWVDGICTGADWKGVVQLQ